MDSLLFSHPVTEESRPGALTVPQEDRYGSLFRQPVYTPSPGSEPAPRQRSGEAAYDPSGRR
ncbi:MULTISPECIES: hypothetical protein [unclassified Amycolatopsis]|uniref:hypothetical protein n=1 Tax=unclassified Amycolatopsis TaxID=2618356 RepID=UPI001FF1FAD7|nr:hypothetical protein [Amycolatopsis sp. FBCC-B4732]UOX93013.1 hypothetical protein MUY14_21205 [Amycolatopsis sp. FBCC-B4732]